MKKNNTARKTYKRAPRVPVKNNVVMFPGVVRPAAVSPLAAWCERQLGGFDLNRYLTETFGECTCEIVGDVVEISDARGVVVLSCVPGEVTE